jgi:hypothetical protein
MAELLAKVVPVPGEVATFFTKEPETLIPEGWPPEVAGQLKFLRTDVALPASLEGFGPTEIVELALGHLEKLRAEGLTDADLALQFIARQMSLQMLQLKDADTSLVDTVAKLAEARTGYGLRPESGASSDNVRLIEQIRETYTVTQNLLIASVWVWYYISQSVDRPEQAPPDPAALLEQIRVLRDEANALKAKVADLSNGNGSDSHGSRNPNSAPVSAIEPASRGSRRPPAPTFSGEKTGVDVITWITQFGHYASILALHPDELVAHASLCLKGQAAKDWALLHKTLSAQGKDANDFSVFKDAMTCHFVEADVEATVRVRLSKLKQTDTVAAYHAAFRAIMVEAVQYPVSGPEACSYFRAGLKPYIAKQLLLDSSIRREMAQLDVVVEAAKHVETYLGLLSSPSVPDLDKGKRPSGAPPPRVPDQGKKAKVETPVLTDAQKEEYRAKGLCYKCGRRGHLASNCPQPSSS